MLAQGVSIRAAARALGVCDGTLRRRLREAQEHEPRTDAAPAHENAREGA